MTNLELKARLQNFAKTHSILAQHRVPLAATLRQTDTYFHVENGRLKLREIDGETAQLIFYQRADQAEVKRSDYLIAPVTSAAALREVLDAACGTQTVIKKTRELYWLPRKYGAYAGRAAPDLIRLHLDTVERLGHFLEIEVILQEGESPHLAGQEAEFWLREFCVPREDLMAESYADLFLKRSPVLCAGSLFA
jgi:adenylate cyclase class IV